MPELGGQWEEVPATRRSTPRGTGWIVRDRSNYVFEKAVVQRPYEFGLQISLVDDREHLERWISHYIDLPEDRL